MSPFSNPSMTVAGQYLAAAEAAAELLARPAVADRWREQSVLPLYPVSGLAGHLAGQIGVVVKVVDLPELPYDTVVVSGAEFIAHGRWIDAPDDSAAHASIRESGRVYAESGPDALASGAHRNLEQLRSALPGLDLSRPVQFPWGPPALTWADLLVNRMMELVVHSDDLATSVGLPGPELPAEVAATVTDLLTRVAAMRHGWPAVVRSLTRPDRLDQPVTAF